MGRRPERYRKWIFRWKGCTFTYIPETGRLLAENGGVLQAFETNSGGWRATSAKFLPICLTVFLSNKCNLNCVYCYAEDEAHHPYLRIDPEALREAAHWVAANCQAQNLPFTLGFHGGNDPLAYPASVEKVIAIIRSVADNYGIDVEVYCTTNGVVPVKTATWAASVFTGITLSWDGPDDIQNAARLRKYGGGTASTVRQTSQILRNPVNGLKHFKVRSTVCAGNEQSLSEIARFFHKEGVQSLDIFPAYSQAPRDVSESWVPDSKLFARNFLDARNWAVRHGMQIVYAASRMGTFHGRFCYLFQNNLAVTPDGYFTGCFLATSNLEGQNDTYMFGKLSDAPAWRMQMEGRIDLLSARMSTTFAECETCFNRFHCAMGCPTVCPLTHAGASLPSGFDCNGERVIGLANLLWSAGVSVGSGDWEALDEAIRTMSFEPSYDSQL